MPLVCYDSYDILLIADDAKISKNIIDINDKNKFQVAFSNVAQRSNTWLLSLNIRKCLTLNIRKIKRDINEQHITRDKGDKF